MRHEGLLIFLLFFGVFLLDALASGYWWLALFWLTVGLAFALVDRWNRPKRILH
jgi:hypothetical protein